MRCFTNWAIAICNVPFALIHSRLSAFRDCNHSGPDLANSQRGSQVMGDNCMERLLERLIQDYLAISVEIDGLDSTKDFNESFRLLQKRAEIGRMIAKLESELHRETA
jgi:hypothetical protein